MTKLEAMSARPAGTLSRREQLEWLAGFLLGDRDVPSNDVPLDQHTLSRFSPHWADQSGLIGICELMRRGNRRAPFAADRLEIADDTVTLRDSHEHVWHMTFVFDAERRFASLDIDFELAEGLRYRLGSDADMEAIEALDTAAPLPVGEGLCWVDRRGGTGNAIRLLGDNRMAVVEQGSEIVAGCGSVMIEAQVAGRVFDLNYAHHVRVEEQVRGRGLVPVVAAGAEASIAHLSAGVISVVHAENKCAAKNQPHLWQAGGLRAVFDCASIGQKVPVGAAGPADAEQLCGLINDAHSGQEWFRPYTPAILAERLQRAPEAYGWPNLRRTDRAMIGVWSSGEQRRYELPDRQWTETRGQILDYGMAPDGQGLDDLELLLRASAAEALEVGITHLSAFTAAAAPVFPMFERLAQRMEPYVVSCSIPEPPDAVDRGVYIDPVLA